MRTTSDPKPVKLELRLSEDLKAYFQKQADKDGVSLSEHIREELTTIRDMRSKP